MGLHCRSRGYAASLTPDQLAQARDGLSVAGRQARPGSLAAELIGAYRDAVGSEFSGRSVADSDAERAQQAYRSEHARGAR